MNARRLTQGHGQTDAQGAYATHAYFSRSPMAQALIDVFAPTFLSLLAIVVAVALSMSLYFAFRM